MFSVVDPCRRQRGQWPDLSGTWVQRDGSSSRSLALHYPRAWSRRRSRVRNLQPGRLELAQRGCFLKHSQNIVFTRRLQCVGGDPIYQSCLSCLGLGSPFFFGPTVRPPPSLLRHLTIPSSVFMLVSPTHGHLSLLVVEILCVE